MQYVSRAALGEMFQGGAVGSRELYTTLRGIPCSSKPVADTGMLAKKATGRSRRGMILSKR